MKGNSKWILAMVMGGLIAMQPTFAVCATLSNSKENLWGSALVYTALLILIFLMLVLMRSAIKLNEASNQEKQAGTIWIRQRLYDFDAEQLDFLIHEIKKTKNQKHTKKIEKIN